MYKLPTPVKWGLGIGGSFLVYKIGKHEYDKIQEKNRLKQAEKTFKDAQVPVTVKNSDGTSTTVTLNTAVAATKIYDAIHNNDWFGWTENEEAIITILKAIPKAYIPDVEKHYMTLYKKNLQQEVIAALSAEQFREVDYLFD